MFSKFLPVTLTSGSHSRPTIPISHSTSTFKGVPASQTLHAPGRTGPSLPLSPGAATLHQLFQQKMSPISKNTPNSFYLSISTAIALDQVTRISHWNYDRNLFQFLCNTFG
jgi:hypothetical protein